MGPTVQRNVRVRMVHCVMVKLVLALARLDGLGQTVTNPVSRVNMGQNVFRPATA